MNRFSKIVKLMVPAVILFSLSGCFQYPEGPIFSLQTKDERLGGSWKLVGVTDDQGQDITSSATTTYDTTVVISGPDTTVTIDTISEVPYANTVLTVIVNHSSTSTWTVYQDTRLEDEATYQFSKYNDYIILAYTTLGGKQTNIERFFTIRKLTEKEFKYIDDYGYTFDWEKY